MILVPRHRREVCSLARRVMLPKALAQPVSAPLQGGLRFFPPPYPHRHQWALWLSYLSCDRSDTGLPRSTRLTLMGEVLSLRRERCVSMTGYYRDPVPAPVPFGASLSASLAWCSSRRLSRVHMCSPHH